MHTHAHIVFHTQVRTVAAYGGEERTLAAYNAALEGPVKLGIRQSLYTGLALGGVNAIVYYTYARRWCHLDLSQPCLAHTSPGPQGPACMSFLSARAESAA